MAPGMPATPRYGTRSTRVADPIINEGGTGNGAFGGSTQFRPASPTAADSLLIANGGIDGGGGGRVAFGEFGGGTATAANATLVANGETEQEGEGGQLIFDADTLGGTAHVQLFGNGFLDISLHNLLGLTIGSLTGNGPVFLGGNNLTIRSRNEATTFDGVLQDGSENGGTGGSLSKIGTGKLTLTAANTYTGGTTVNGGTLLVNNTTGSGVGTGQVQAFSGILGGSGVISGRVTMGTGHGAGATLQRALIQCSWDTKLFGSSSPSSPTPPIESHLTVALPRPPIRLSPMVFVSWGRGLLSMKRTMRRFRRGRYLR